MFVAGSGCSITLKGMVKDGGMADVEEGEISDAASVEEISEEDFNKQEGKISMEVKQMAAAVGGVDGDGDGDGGAVVGGKGGSNGNSRVWTMQDLMSKYPGCRGYAASGLYSFAWAQAVQNKPLNEPSKNTKGCSESNSKEGHKIVVEDSGDEKEEGELEEGEIDLESDPVDKVAAGIQIEIESGDSCRDMGNADSIQTDTKEKDLENRVKLIRSVLESTSLVEAHTAFEGVCSRLLAALESLRELVSENDHFPKRDTLVQLSFAALQTMNSVFCSMKKTSKELNKETMFRLLSLVKSHFSPFLSSNQIKEIEAMDQSLSCFDVTLCTGTSNKEEEGQVIDGIAQKEYDNMAANVGSAFSYTNKLSTLGDSFAANKLFLSSEASKRGSSNLRSRAPLLPLLDLHKDHDADSLPSPTRETTPCLPVNGPHTLGHGMVKPGLSAGKVGKPTDDAKIHPYENDALKAFSTYQQKFGRNSLFRTDSLPSPTPSEESNDGNGDIGGEVSSSVVTNSEPGSFLISGQHVPLLSNVDATDLPRINGAPSAIPPSYVSSPSVPSNNTSELTVKPSAKSRDPRLRFANPDCTTLTINQHSSFNLGNIPKVEPSGMLMSSRKQKAADESFVDGPASKRQKNGLESHEGVKDAPKAAGSGGWLEDADSLGPSSHLVQKAESNPRIMGSGVTSMTRSVMPGATVSMSEPVPVTAATSTVSLPSLLKDMVVNPTMLFNLLNMGEKLRATESAHHKPTDPRRAAQLPGSSILGAVSPLSVSASSPLANFSKPGGTPQVSSQGIPADESGKIRMKPRDPRRVLHGNTLQRTGSLVEKQFKANEPHISGTPGVKDKTEERAETKPVPSQLVQLQEIGQHVTNSIKNVGDLLAGNAPDIAPQFTKNLKNIANIVTVSQVGNAPVIPQNQLPQSVQLKTDGDVEHPASSSGDQQFVAGSVSAAAATGPARPLNSWGDVEHLFNGYDDKQKAAIQRERARRLEEQKKMFAARKLCLVLDLDHTLLNSAKFNEVDPVHDEILRKKEEQDREKPHRHLFRFPHMGMWTKLRPGIWNFLEKASKLYELHLYTMGNKLYATEMAKVLDPKGVLFNGRVISRGDDGEPFDGDERVPKSKDLEGVLGMESAVVIIDDSVRVWPHNKMNLIVVERYTYFPCSRRQFGLLGPSLLEIDHDERPEDGTLASSLAVIERIHQKFFSQSSLDEADVRNILASEQRKILAGCRIVFSRVFPVGEANPHLHPLWQTAEQFGAVCRTQIDEHVTHVVANSLGTDKVNWALSSGRFVVHPGWVEASALLYRRANELDFAIKP